MENILETSKKQLQQPLKDARRKLIIILNVLFIVLLVFYLCFDRITTGSYVPHYKLYFVYGVPFLLNLASLVYNLKYLQVDRRGETQSDILFRFLFFDKIDKILGWLCLLPILIMSFCNMVGVGNPSNDAILTDYALANSLIIGTLIILGRKPAFIWFLIVMGVLFWDVTRIGWDYEYHYLTPTEVVKYKQALKNNEPSAILRKHELAKSGLNPPKITRYFSAWFVFIIVTFVTACFFSGISVDMFKIVPRVVLNIEKAIEDNNRVLSELENKQKEAANASLRIIKLKEIIGTLNEEIDKLNHLEKKKLQKAVNLLRKSVDEGDDWDKFQTSFDATQNDFFKLLHDRFPNLSKTELKHLAYIRMNQTNKEIAKLLDVKVDTLRTLRHRLKKKIALTEEVDLVEYVQKL